MSDRISTRCSPSLNSTASSTSKRTRPMPWPPSRGSYPDMETVMIDPWLWRYDRVIASDTSVARQVLDEMLAQLEAQRWQQRDIFAVHLATEEALVNAIHHGNGSDAQKNVHFVCLLGGDRVRIEISDEGPGFDPS